MSFMYCVKLWSPCSELCLQDTERSQDSDFNSPDSPDGDVTTPDPRVKFRDLLDQLKDLESVYTCKNS